MADKTKTDISVTFNKTCVSSSSNSFSFEADSDKNGSKSTFQAVDDTAYYRLWPGGKAPTLWASLGTVSNTGTASETITENITIYKSKSGTLSKLPVGDVTYSWTGSHVGDATPTFADKAISFASEMTGILSCSYEAYYDTIEINTSTSGSILVTAEKDDMTGDTTIDFTGTSTQRKVYLTVKDACNKEILAGVAVSLRLADSDPWTSVGTTDAKGQIYLGELWTGKKYKLKLVKSGYYDSDKDTIKNDEFTVADDSTTSKTSSTK
ncbi:MAG: hypothetical protein HQK98_08390 [Nitrospirae bacterium]|nr:hypothetical protein [Nitrospirota bacterium]